MYKVHDKVRVAPSGQFGLITAVDQDADAYMVAMHGLMDPVRLPESDLTLIDEKGFENAKDVIDNLDRIELFAKVQADGADDTRIFMQVYPDLDDEHEANILFMAGDGPKKEVAELGNPETKEFMDKLRKIGLEQIDKADFEPAPDDVADGYKWRLALYSGTSSVAVGGRNAYPHQIPELYRLFESYGVPKVWDDMADGPYYKYSVD